MWSIGFRRGTGATESTSPLRAPWSARRGSRLRVLLSVAALTVAAGNGPLVALSTGGPQPVALPPVTLAGSPVTCGTPGKDGPAGTLAGVVDEYFPGTASAAAGATSIAVGTARGAATTLSAGDLLLVIQMQAASINATNTSSYGDGVAGDPGSGSTALNGVGTYEYVTATGPVAGGAVPVAGAGATSGLVHSYLENPATATQGQQTFQVIRVPQYSSATLGSTLTASAWDGSSGGVLAIDVAGATNLGGATVSVDTLGFRGGAAYMQTGDGTGTLTGTDYRGLSTLAAHGQKAEGIAGTPAFVWNQVGGAIVTTGQANDGYPNGSSARGAPGTAGGGGTDPHPAANDQNTGGGGGGNGGAGGSGGNSWSTNLAVGGFGGVAYPASAGQLTLGGGGGAGTRNNTGVTGTSSGGTGGGAVMLRSGTVTGTGTISANGGAGPAPVNDGGGGGGAGGTVLVAAASGTLSGLTVDANGGAGANAWPTSPPGTNNINAHGPGGGGAGGVVIASSAPGAETVAGGTNGTTTTGLLQYGAQPGSPGQTITAAVTTPGVQPGSSCLPAMTLTKTTSTPTVVETPTGTTATFTVTLSNATGTGTAITAQLSDPLPTGFTYASTVGSPALSGGATRTATVNPSAGATTPVFGTFSIPGGGSVAVTFTAAIASTVAPGTYSNTGAGTYSDPQRLTAGGTLTVTSTPVTVTLTAPDMVITKSHTGNFTVGQSGSYTLTASNAGNATTSGTVTVSDTLPAGLTPTAAAGSLWSCSIVGQTVTCTRSDTLAAGSSYPGVAVTVSVGAAAAPSVTNTASVSGGGELNTGNDTASDPTTVTPSADLAITKSHTGNFTVGVNGTYSLTVTNSGPSASGALTVTDPLPAGLGFVSGTGTNWSCSASGQTVTCANPTGLASGANSTITLTVTVASAAAPSVTNTASVAGTAVDPNPSNNMASDPTTVGTSADVSIVKSHTGTFTVGVNGVFTLAVANTGPSPSGTLTVTDTLPAGLGFVSGTGANWACSASGQVVTCANSTGLAAGANAPITVTVSVALAAVPSTTNSATVSAAAPDPNSGNNTSTDTVTVGTSADVSIAKSHSGSFTAGQNGTYTLAVANAGPSPSGALTVTDTLPNGLGFVTGTGAGWACSAAGQTVTCTNSGGLAAGGNSSIALVVSVGQAAVPGITNTATVSGTAPDPVPGNNSSSDATTVNPAADVSIVKTHNGTFIVGQNGTYTLAVANAGPSSSEALTVTDTLPAALTFVSGSGTGWTCSASGQTVTCTNATGLASGGNSSITLTVLVGPGAAGGVTNTAQVSSAVLDPNPANNSSTDSTAAPSADVSIVKTHTSAFIVGAGATYNLAVANAGPSASGALTVTDTLPAGLTFASGSGTGWTCTASGQAVTCTNATGLAGSGTSAITLTVLVGTAAQPSVTNTAAVQSATFDPNSANNSSSDTVAVTTSADVSVVKSHTGTFTVGTNGVFTLAVANAGPSATGALTVSDTLPAGLGFVGGTGTGWTCSASGQAVTCTNATGLASGGAASIALTVAVGPAAAPGVTNTATVTGTAPDPNSANNSSSDTVTVVSSADVRIVKSHSGSFTAGQNGIYTLAVSNAGPSPSGALTVTDTLPAGLTFVSGTGIGWACSVSGQRVTCTSGSGLASGGGSSITLTVAVGASAVPSVSNTASVSGTAPDPNPANNSSTDPTTVNGAADVSIVKSHTGSFTAGASGVYTLAVANAGPSPSGSLTITDALPSGLTYVNGTETNWSCAASGQTVTCSNLAGLASGANSSVTLTVAAGAGAVPSVTNTASVMSATGDPNPANNTSSDPTTVNRAGDLSIVKSHSGSFTVGENGVYTLAVANAGPGPSGALTVTDTLPAGLTYVSGTGTGWTCTSNAQTVTCSDPGGLASGGSDSITLTVSVSTAAAPGVTNTASVAGTTTDPDPADNTSSDATPVLAVDLALVKAAAGTFAPGGDGTYTLTVTNLGTGATFAPISVVDPLPSSLGYVSASGTGWSCAAAGQTVTCTTSTVLAAGGTSVITLITRVAGSASGAVTNTASVATVGDVNAFNNSDTAVAAVITTGGPLLGPPSVGAGLAGRLPIGLPLLIGGLALLAAGRRRDVDDVDGR